MSTFTSPEIVVQRQLDAYNAKNLDALLATYAPQAQMFEHPVKLLAMGHAEIRERIAARFAEPDLHARLVKRSVTACLVVDHEDVRRTFADGPGNMEMIAVYVVGSGLIQSASFIFDPLVR